jgi:pimeloyl-ACP methyl ester carboxylesterase
VTAVFVNGNPESAAIWDLLGAELDEPDVVRLSPPGFGAPIPDGFACTLSAYRDWLVAELEALGEPVDLVGHDVGGSTVVSVAMTRPDLLGGTRDERTERMVSRGIPGPVAARLAAAQGPEMGRPSWLSAGPPSSRPWPSWARACPPPRPSRAWPSSAPRTISSAPRRCAAGPRPGPVPGWRSSTGWATGGWCRTPSAANEP